MRVLQPTVHIPEAIGTIKIKANGSLQQTRSSTTQKQQNQTAAQELANAQREQFKGKYEAVLLFPWN